MWLFAHELIDADGVFLAIGRHCGSYWAPENQGQNTVCGEL
jgi:hypothetical protein